MEIEERSDACPLCGGIFEPGEKDVVVQPETGIQYHQACYDREMGTSKTA